MASRLGRFIDEVFGDVTLEALAGLTGITVPNLSRIKNGAPPSLRNALRLASAAGVNPAQIHELAGQPELASLYERILPPRMPKHTPRQARLLGRCERLIGVGFLDFLEEMIERGERERWGAMRLALRGMAERMGASAAAVLVESGEGRAALAQWNCDDAQLRALEKSPDECRGWGIHRVKRKPADRRLVLALRGTVGDRQGMARYFLEIWTDSIGIH